MCKRATGDRRSVDTKDRMYGFTRYLMVIIGFASFGFAIVSVNFSRNYKSIEKKKRKAQHRRSKQGGLRNAYRHGETACVSSSWNNVSLSNLGRDSEWKK